jgi:hypothetical protein
MKAEFSTNANLVDRELAELASRLELSRKLIASGRPGAPMSLQHAAMAAKASAGIETLSASMLNTEQAYLVERRDRTLREGRLLIAFGGGGTAFAIVLLALLMRGLQREIKHSRKLERQAHHSSAGLEVSLAELARVSEQRRVLSGVARSRRRRPLPRKIARSRSHCGRGAT